MLFIGGKNKNTLTLVGFLLQESEVYTRALIGQFRGADGGWGLVSLTGINKRKN